VNNRGGYLAIVFIVTLLFGCGTSIYTNSSYSFKAAQPPTIAVLPIVSQSSAVVIDSSFEKLFEEISSKYPLEFPSTIRKRFTLDANKTKLMQAISSVEYHLASGAPAPTLQAAIDPGGFSALHDMLPNSTVLLVPALFSLKQLPGMVKGETTFRLYDLESGALIYEYFISVNVLPNGRVTSGGLLASSMKGSDVDLEASAEARRCVAILAAYGKSSLQSNYLDKIKQ
jgi:hypothetical protein